MSRNLSPRRSVFSRSGRNAGATVHDLFRQEPSCEGRSFLLFFPLSCLFVSRVSFLSFQFLRLLFVPDPSLCSLFTFPSVRSVPVLSDVGYVYRLTTAGSAVDLRRCDNELIHQCINQSVYQSIDQPTTQPTK